MCAIVLESQSVAVPEHIPTFLSMFPSGLHSVFFAVISLVFFFCSFVSISFYYSVGSFVAVLSLRLTDCFDVFFWREEFPVGVPLLATLAADVARFPDACVDSSRASVFPSVLLSGPLAVLCIDINSFVHMSVPMFLMAPR